MDPFFNPAAIKPHQQIIEEYRRSESTEDWLVEEVADFFATSNDTDIEAIERACALIEADEEGFDKFAASERQDGDLLAFIVRITRAGTLVAHQNFAVVPTPTSLLQLCCEVAKEDDIVTVIHHLANDPDIAMSSAWPFGMYEAAMMSTPNPQELATSVSEATADNTADKVTDKTPTTIFRSLLGRLLIGAGVASLILAHTIFTRRQPQ